MAVEDFLTMTGQSIGYRAGAGENFVLAVSHMAITTKDLNDRLAAQEILLSYLLLHMTSQASDPAAELEAISRDLTAYARSKADDLRRQRVILMAKDVVQGLALQLRSKTFQA